MPDLLSNVSPNLYVADANGEFRGSEGLQVHDGTRARNVVGAWVYDDVAGGWRTHVDTAALISIDATAENHFQILVTWTSTLADSIKITVNGDTKFTSTSASGTTRIVVTPGETYDVRGVWVSGENETASLPVSVTMPDVPTPANFRVTGVTNNSITYAWDPVELNPTASLSSYRLFNASGEFIASAPVSSLKLTRSGLSQGASYTSYLVAAWTTNPNVWSAPTPSVTQQTSLRLPAATYTFSAGIARTYNWTTSKWRSDNASKSRLWHGRQSTSAGDSGRQITFFYNYTDSSGKSPWQRIGAPGLDYRVTKFEVYLQRISTSHGSNTAQKCYWGLHNQAYYPNDPGGTFTKGWAQVGSLALGEGKWFTLNSAWATTLINETKTNNRGGVSWGHPNSDVGYIVAQYGLSAGRIRITTD